MKWTTETPKYGDVIRVKVKFYYHYGIFVDEDCIVQFGMPDNSGVNLDDIEVITTNVDIFKNGGSVETAVFQLVRNCVKTAIKRLLKRRYPD